MNADGSGEGPEFRDIVEDIWTWFKDWASQRSRLLLAGLALLIVGFLGGLIFGGGLFGLLFFVGLILVVVWVLRRYRILRQREIVERWSILIAGGQGEAETVFEETRRLIEESKAPDVKMERDEVAPGFIRGVLGGTRDFLLLSNTANSNLKPYRMYINARDYGDNLDISWYVVYQPGFWRRLLAFLLLVPVLNLFILPFFLLERLTRARQAGILDLDIFDQQDLTAYVTNAHHCMREAVEHLMTGMGRDTSEVDWTSKGFLGIS